MRNFFVQSAHLLDLSSAVIFYPGASAPLTIKAVEVLTDEIRKRTGRSPAATSNPPTAGQTTIVVGTQTALAALAIPGLDELTADGAEPGEEGFRLCTCRTAGRVWIVGSDDRGVLYGIGKLLRRMEMGSGYAGVEDGLRCAETPYYSLRGTQLAYRPKNHAYDAWRADQFDQYIRELALFGANSIEILPPRTDDAALSPVMPEDPLVMMIRLGEIIDSYGLDTWIWYPNMADDYRDPATVARELAEREHIFRQIPRIHGLMIPGGDPGDVEADLLFEWCGQVAETLNRHHPDAKIWLSPQVMDSGHAAEWLDTFLRCVRAEPEWLGGVTFGAWVRTPLQELRKLVPARYPIRRYEDVCHNYRCQYPVHDWDLAFALTYRRESINPRPAAFKHIHNLWKDECVGNITYSEGIGDDVNKFVFLDQDWNPDTPVIATLRDYGRLFFGPQYAEPVAQGLLALERNWQGSLRANEQVEQTFEHWRLVERQAAEDGLDHYRLQMGLLRAYYDVYQRRRLLEETALERQALASLEGTYRRDTRLAMAQAEEIWRRRAVESAAGGIRARCDKLADALFRSIGAQTSVERHHASHWERGAFMSTIDTPLNNREYWMTTIAEIRRLHGEDERRAAIGKALHRTDPGPGGFYDNFGSLNPGMERVDFGIGWTLDPGHLLTPRAHFEPALLHMDESRKRGLGGVPLAWLSSASGLYDVPLLIRYDGLDPRASYSVMVVFTGRPKSAYKVRLTAGGIVVRDEIEVRGVQIIEAPIPDEAVRDGQLALSFENLGGERGRDVAEVWVMRRAD